jgi:protein TonB
MTAELLDHRRRALGFAGAVGIHLLAIALLLLLAPPLAKPPAAPPGLVAVQLDEPPPPPADDAEEGAAAPTSRGTREAPSPPEPPVPLARPTPAVDSVDPGLQQGSGIGGVPGAGAGEGGAGSGTGAGDAGTGTGRGSGAMTPPVRVAGALTDADYRRTRPPEGAAGTVVVGFRVRADGAVDRCIVLRTSGYEVLDSATCRLIERRFRYRPARDADGRAVDWDARTDFTWGPR